MNRQDVEDIVHAEMAKPGNRQPEKSHIAGYLLAFAAGAAIMGTIWQYTAVPSDLASYDPSTPPTPAPSATPPASPLAAEATHAAGTLAGGTAASLLADAAEAVLAAV